VEFPLSTFRNVIKAVDQIAAGYRY